MKKRLSVINGRFQVAELSIGHQDFIKRVIERSDETVILLGTPSTKDTDRDSLDYETREIYFQSLFPSAHILKSRNFKYDEIWSANIDSLIENRFDLSEYDVFFCGSRDSCLPHYSGKFISEYIESIESPSGTDQRAEIVKKPINSVDFRKGVIYSANKKYPVSYQAVDVAILDDHGKILLGRKPNEKLFRFIGGVVDPSDISLEYTGKREAQEEAGKAEFDGFEYVGSYRIDDWRYRVCQDKIMSVLFTCKYIYGTLKASDDIKEIRWFNINELTTADLEPEHHDLLAGLIKKLNK